MAETVQITPWASFDARLAGQHLLRHLERVDLLLQRRYYLRADRAWQGGALLCMDDIEQRLVGPRGQPGWLALEYDLHQAVPPPLEIEPDEPLGQLMARFGLIPFEVEVLLLG